MGTYYTYVLGIESATLDQLAEIHTYLQFRRKDFWPFDLDDPWTNGYRDVRNRDPKAQHMRTYDSLGESGAWDKEADLMYALSKAFPTTLFSVHWTDQGTGDKEAESYTYWQTGKLQECEAQLVFAPFNKAKLRPYKKRRTA